MRDLLHLKTKKDDFSVLVVNFGIVAKYIFFLVVVVHTSGIRMTEPLQSWKSW